MNQQKEEEKVHKDEKEEIYKNTLAEITETENLLTS